jgi:hypothetical protein
MPTPVREGQVEAAHHRFAGELADEQRRDRGQHAYTSWAR